MSAESVHNYYNDYARFKVDTLRHAHEDLDRAIDALETVMMVCGMGERMPTEYLEIMGKQATDALDRAYETREEIYHLRLREDPEWIPGQKKGEVKENEPEKEPD